MKMVLDGIRVIDWTIHQLGPSASSLLADLGAEVIKVEETKTGDPMRGMVEVLGVPVKLAGGINIQYELFNRNKKGIAVNLKQEGGREVVYRLVERSDVFVQNFRPGVAERLKMDYETLRRFNPTIIYASGSGLGKKGPQAEKPALDGVGLARAGILLTDAEPGQSELPFRIPVGIADRLGSMMLSFGVIAALLARERHGIGQEVGASHLGSLIALQNPLLGRFLLIGRAGDSNKRSEARNPLDNYYRCKDGRWLLLQLVQSERHWPSLCKGLGMEHLVEDLPFCNAEKRKENCKELVAILDSVFASKDSQEWTTILQSVSKDLVFAVVQSYHDLMSDPQVIANEYIVEYDHPVLGRIKTTGFPVSFSETPPAIRLPAPQHGQHTEEILTEILGYSWEELEKLKDAGVIL